MRTQKATQTNWLPIVAALAIGVAVSRCNNPTPVPPVPPDPPGPVVPVVDGARTILVLRSQAQITPEQAATLREFRELIDLWYADAKNEATVFLQVEPDAGDENDATHPQIARYATVARNSLPYMFALVDGPGGPQIAQQGPLPDVATLCKLAEVPDRYQRRALAPPLSDDRFRDLTDVDLSNPPEGRQTGYLGDVNPESAEAMRQIPTLREVFQGAVIPRADWDKWIDAVAERTYRQIRTIKDQDGEGSCVGNGGANCFEHASHMQFGDRYYRPMSAMSLYKRIGRSAKSGAYVGDAVDEILERGLLPLDTPENRAAFPHVHPAIGFAKSLPAGWESTGRQFRGTWIRIDDVESWFTALVRLQAEIIYGRQGHCIASVYPVRRNNKYYFSYENSWGTHWGDPPGIGYDSESLISKCTGYALVNVTIRPEIRIPPYPAVALMDDVSHRLAGVEGTLRDLTTAVGNTPNGPAPVPANSPTASGFSPEDQKAIRDMTEACRRYLDAARAAGHTSPAPKRTTTSSVWYRRPAAACAA